MPDLPRNVQPGGVSPQWVGDGDSRRNVAALDDRGIALAALDAVLRASDSLKRHSDEFRLFRKLYEDDKIVLLKTLSNHEKRITALEHRGDAASAAPVIPPDRPTVPERLSQEAEESSWHEWDADFIKAAAELSRRVKDPKDRLDSVRAREIAQEVVTGTKVAEDAKSFRIIKKVGWRGALEIGKWILAAAAGAFGAKYGLHLN